MKLIDDPEWLENNCTLDLEVTIWISNHVVNANTPSIGDIFEIRYSKGAFPIKLTSKSDGRPIKGINSITQLDKLKKHKRIDLAYVQTIDTVLVEPQSYYNSDGDEIFPDTYEELKSISMRFMNFTDQGITQISNLTSSNNLTSKGCMSLLIYVAVFFRILIDK